MSSIKLESLENIKIRKKVAENHQTDQMFTFSVTHTRRIFLGIVIFLSDAKKNRLHSALNKEKRIKNMKRISSIKYDDFL